MDYEFDDMFLLALMLGSAATAIAVLIIVLKTQKKAEKGDIEQDVSAVQDSARKDDPVATVAHQQREDATNLY